MNKIIHHNYWYWGQSYIITIDNGKGVVNIQISNDDKERGCINGLSVAKRYRNQGLGDILLIEAQNLAKKLRLKEVYLTTEKNSFTFEWYKRKGFVKDNYRNKNLYRLRKRV